MTLPSCFIIMPFGKKKDAQGQEYDFDKIYEFLIRPAVETAGMQVNRADEETVNGIIHKPMYERLILSDYAIADLTTANANVFYELGVRHAVKPFATISIFAMGSWLPFDVNFLRCMPYQYLENYQRNERDISLLVEKLNNAKKAKTTDSPLYQLVDGIHFQNSVAHEKTDIFRDKVMYDEQLKNELRRLRAATHNDDEKLGELEKFIAEHQPLENLEAAVLIDIMLTFRSLEKFEEMIAFIQSVPLHVQQTTMVQEQWAFALNRLKTAPARQEAINRLEKVIEKQGPGSETYGIMGRIYKDMFAEALQQGKTLMAEAMHQKALEVYLKGFYADWRDAYPGVNALMLLELKGDKDSLQRLSPVVEFAVLRKMERKDPDYWDYASLMEIAVIENNFSQAREYVMRLMVTVKEKWMVNTTLSNLQLIKSYRLQRGADIAPLDEIIDMMRSL